ncbi:hypothetical protein GW17_00060153 [Ensete ventricosum]|nr:hypothetical protein GW17_00060153 [Ensete ventricosum]
MRRHIAAADSASPITVLPKVLDMPLREVHHQASLLGQPYPGPRARVPQLQAHRRHLKRAIQRCRRGRRSGVVGRLLRLFFLLLYGVQIDPHFIQKPKEAKSPGTEGETKQERSQIQGMRGQWAQKGAEMGMDGSRVAGGRFTSAATARETFYLIQALLSVGVVSLSLSVLHQMTRRKSSSAFPPVAVSTIARCHPCCRSQ